MRTRKEKWRRTSKGSHSSSVSGSNRILWLRTWKKAMGWCTAQWKMLLFYAKPIVKKPRKFELARLKKKKKGKHFGRLATFWFGTFAMLFSATGCVVRHENTRRWTVAGPYITFFARGGNLPGGKLSNILRDRWVSDSLGLHTAEADLGMLKGRCRYCAGP